MAPIYMLEVLLFITEPNILRSETSFGSSSKMKTHALGMH